MTSGRRRPKSSTRPAKVRIEATRWPVCHTPPRVVVNQTAVLKPQSATSHRRSWMERTPIRASIHQQAPRPAAASTALTSGCHCVTTSGPKTATRGMSAIAGNGAKGTKTRSPMMITS